MVSERGLSRLCLSVLYSAVFQASVLPVTQSAGSTPQCEDSDARCRVRSLTERLEATGSEMRGRRFVTSALENLRSGILTGQRTDMPSAQRQHFEKHTSAISDVTFDERLRPVSTNTTHHFSSVRKLASNLEVRHFTFMALKRTSGGSGKAGPSALLVVIDQASKLSLFTVEGEEVLDGFDLGHSSSVMRLALSPSQDNHIIMTADENGEVRVHSLKIVASTEKKENADGEEEQERQEKGKSKKRLIVSANFTVAFSLPEGPDGEVRKLNVILALDRGTHSFVTGDNKGGIAVFMKNGTMKGRVRVTEDPGGVRGLIRSQGQVVFFYSSHSFGYFSATQIDVQYPPCSGWNSPLYDVALEASTSSSKVLLALEDGDILVFLTTRGKSKVCDLSLKFPHVSNVPFKLHAMRGHIVGLPMPSQHVPGPKSVSRDVFVFNVAAMDAGYGLTHSRAVAMQASFAPRQPNSFEIHGTPFSSTGSAADRTKSSIALRFVGEKGVELFDLSLKMPPVVKTAADVAGGGSRSTFDLGGESSIVDDNQDSGESSPLDFLNWFPKIGMFGMVLIGAVVWNAFKATKQRAHGGFDDLDKPFDHDNFKPFIERGVKERRAQKEKEKAEAAARERGGERSSGPGRFAGENDHGGGDGSD